MRYSHASLTVASIDRSVRFYTEALGLEPAGRRRIEETRAEIAFVRDPSTGVRIEFTAWDERPPGPPGDQLDHLAFEVEDLEGAIARAVQHGARIGKAPYRLAGGAHRIAFLIDPDEVWIELIEVRGPSPSG
ncbi:MAG: VOC family protein [Thermoplasmata archaeon]